MTDPVILDSAHRHGLTDEQIIHAYNNVMFIEPGDEEDFTMLIGPDQAANLLEIGIIPHFTGTVFIVHAMRARRKYLR